MRKKKPLGESVQSGYRRICAICFLSGCAVALMMSAITFFLDKFSFATADEAWMALALAGSFAKPATWVPYLSPLFTRVLALLYGFNSSVPWYVLFQMGSVIFSMIVINVCVFDRVRRYFPDRALVPGILFCLLADMPLCWTLSRLTLYHVAVITGSAALCLLLGKIRERRFAFAGIVATVLAFISISCAPVVGAGLIFCTLAIVLFCRPAGKKDRASGSRIVIRGTCLLLVMGVLLAGTLFASQKARARMNDGSYAEWNALRDTYIKGASGTDDEIEKRYEYAGWSKELTELVSRNFLMDKRFNAKAVSRIVSQDSFAPSTSWNDLVKAAGMQIDANYSKGLILGLAVLLHGICLVCLMLAQGRRVRMKKAGVTVCCALLADLMFIVLLRKGSLNYESAFIVGAPCLIVALLYLTDTACAFVKESLATDWQGEDSLLRNGGKLCFAVVSAVVLAGSLGMYVLNSRAVCAYAGMATTAAAGNTGVDAEYHDAETLDYYKAVLGNESWADEQTAPEILQYLDEHKSTLFVCDEAVLANLNMINSMKVGALSNLYCWSESQRYSLPFSEQQESNGLTRPLSANDFGRDNVYFVSASLDNIHLLHRFLGQKYGLRACVIQRKLKEGPWVVKYQKKYNIDAVIPATDAPVAVSLCDEEGEVSLYKPVVSGKGKKATLHWLGRNEIIVDYHLTGDAEADKAKTRIKFGVMTPTMTSDELGFFRPGYRFLGWNAYRDDTESWLVKDVNGNVLWEKAPFKKGTDYLMYPEGVSLSQIAEPDTVIHLYGVWKKTDICTANYYMTAEGQVRKTQKRMPGVNETQLLDIKDFDYFEAGKRFIGWRAYRSDTQCWSVLTAGGKQAWAKKVPKGGEYRLYGDGAVLEDDFPAGTELRLYAQWEDTESFTVFYHSDDETVSPLTTPVMFGVKTDTLTCQDLDFNKPGKRFVGWRVYRTDTKCWLTRNKGNGKSSWTAKPSKAENYQLWENGHRLSQAVPAGAEIHLYAQWEDTDTFTVYYHMDDSAPADSQTTSVEYGKPTQTLTPEKLKFFVKGKRFAGWKMYRGDSHCWGVIDADGNSGWATTLPEGGSYWLYQAGWSVSEAVPAGCELHFYAQWADTNAYTVYYHKGNSARASGTTTSIRSKKSAVTLTPDELGFAAKGRSFMGWKVYRTDEKMWWVTDASGNHFWSESLPNGGAYFLREGGFILESDVKPGAEVHLYAQWEDSYTVYYHLDDDSPASEITTKIKSGTSERIALFESLGFSLDNKKFTGWRAYRSDTRCWLVENDSDESMWAETKQEGWRYCLLGDEAILSSDIQPGAQVHLYAQWK